MNTAGFMIDRTHALGLGKRSVPLCLFGTRQSGTLRLHTPARRHAELVQAFLRPYRAGRILHAFPGASPQAFVFWPFQGARSPIHRSADPPGFVAPKWAKDFSLGRSPRNPQKSDQALQKKLCSPIGLFIACDVQRSRTRTSSRTRTIGNLPFLRLSLLTSHLGSPLSRTSLCSRLPWFSSH